mgnify:CR=1 FL=1
MLAQKMKLLLAPLALKILRPTLKIPPLCTSISKIEGPIIFAGLHRDLIGSILYLKPARPWLLVSGSDDGLILVRALGDRDFGFIRGATGENGGRALVRLRRTLEAGNHIGLAVDGPKGPFGVIHSGVFQLAKMTGATIVPLLPTVKPSVVLGTWDRTVVPLLFSEISLKIGPLMTLHPNTSEKEIQSLRHQLHSFFQPVSEV